MKKKQGELIGKIKRRYSVVIIISMLLLTLLLASCSQKEGSKGEEANENNTQEKTEVIAKNTINEEANENNTQEKTEVIAKNTINEEANESVFQKQNEANIKNVSKIDTTGFRVITLDAKKWEYSQKEIRIKKGEKVIIKINNVDFDHGIAIPGMKIVGLDEIEVDTSKTGTFEFKCANYCGSGHSTMEGKIIIE